MVVNWRNLSKDALDPTTIDQAVDQAIEAHNENPNAHFGEGGALESHRNAEIIDHRAESVVNDKLAKRARRFVAIVDPNSESDFDTIESAIEYARGIGGGDIYITSGTHYVTQDLEIPSTIGFYGNGMDEAIIRSDTSTNRALHFYNSVYLCDGYGEIPAAAAGTNTIDLHNYKTNPETVKVGQYITIGFPIESTRRITAIDPTTFIATLASAIPTGAGGKESELLPGAYVVNGETVATVQFDSTDNLGLFFAGIRLFNIDGTELGVCKSLDDGGELIFESQFTGSTGWLPVELKAVSDSVINIEGIATTMTTAAIIFTYDRDDQFVNITSCKNLANRLRGGSTSWCTYRSCLFERPAASVTTANHRANNDDVYIDCKFRDTVNDSRGITTNGRPKFYGCKFGYGTYNNNRWILGNNSGVHFIGCEFNGIAGQIFDAINSSSTSPGPTFIGNAFLLADGQAISFMTMRAVITNNTFSRATNTNITLASGSSKTLFANNMINGGTSNSGTNNTVVNNVTG